MVSASHLSASSSDSSLPLPSRRGWWVGGSVATATAVVVTSYAALAHWRHEKTLELPLAFDDDDDDFPCPRTVATLVEMVQRIGLMGQQKSVGAELDRIRQWHHDHGYKGGLILRDLTKPVFGGVELPFQSGPHEEEEDDDDDYGDVTPVPTTPDPHSPTASPPLPAGVRPTAQPTEWTWEEIWEDPTRLARRECYYLYYEVDGTGHIIQQIFCRGTTLAVDVWTCLQAWMVYDEELQCWVHRGFRNQADRILHDVGPLLAPPQQARATVELAGHSLGGAVAAILAMKLRHRGYRVIRLTTVGEPRYVYDDAGRPEEQARWRRWLPADQVRLEADDDFVTFMPFFGAHVGRKIWLVQAGPPRWVDPAQHPWADSVWAQFRWGDAFLRRRAHHRLGHYVQRLQQAASRD